MKEGLHNHNNHVYDSDILICFVSRVSKNWKGGSLAEGKIIWEAHIFFILAVFVQLGLDLSWTLKYVSTTHHKLLEQFYA